MSINGNASQIKKYDPLSVIQAVSGPEWESFMPLAKHEKIVAFHDPVRGSVQVRYHIEKPCRKK